jgi:hypothetical protein
MKLWDTETGQCIKRFGNGKIPYVVRFHPDQDKQNVFLAGMSDKKIIQVNSSRIDEKQELTRGPPSTTSVPAKLLKNTINILVLSTQLPLLTKTGDSLQRPTTRRFEHGISTFQ